MNLVYAQRKASPEAIYNHLMACNKDFIPPLEEKVNISEYSMKIFEKSLTFEAWQGESLVGLVAAYFNDCTLNTAHITDVSVMRSYSGKGVAARLLKNCIDYAAENSFKNIFLEVTRSNSLAVNLYKKLGFDVYEDKGIISIMKLVIGTKGQL
ncbi:MAG: GNAT family N-acetyltransferase [Deltaproteobacteria bacterium HGW-Deltaproteobacteria-12]|jgi:ribosomal-protein-alanine N-acetyltransferase|nr:MAG: GNAT family N-acetyltransferase [Deltaproteobacteria bacterium HGW-Deltaproteobacteria-12]